MKGPSVAIVLASIDARAAIAASVRGFLHDLGDRGRLIVVGRCIAGRSVELATAGRFSPRRGRDALAPGSLAPVLWREGLLASDAEIVAFSTAQMLPRPGHLDALFAPMKHHAASAVGGPIAAGRDLSAVDRARCTHAPVRELLCRRCPRSATFDPPGDNAAYVRRDLDLVADSWRSGFWEIDVHRRLRALGRPIAIAHQAVVDFAGGCSLGGAMSHRLAHARRFGSGRAEGRRAGRQAGPVGGGSGGPAAPVVEDLWESARPWGADRPLAPRSPVSGGASLSLVAGRGSGGDPGAREGPGGVTARPESSRPTPWGDNGHFALNPTERWHAWTRTAREPVTSGILVVGVGSIGAQRAWAVKAARGSSLIAVVDADPARARARGRATGRSLPSRRSTTNASR